MKYKNDNLRAGRRKILKAVSSTLVLPALNSLGKEYTPKEEPKRLVCVGTELGFNPANFIPKGTGKNYKLPVLLKNFTSLKKDMTVVSGSYHPGTKNSHASTHSWLSGVLSTNTSSFEEGNISLDQKLANTYGRQTRYPSLQIGSTINFSWTANGIPLKPEEKPLKIFKKLFANDKGQEKQVTRVLAENRSILDEHLAEFKSIHSQLDQADKEKFEKYHSSLRDVEKKIVQQQKWFKIPKPKTAYKLPPYSRDITKLLPVYFELIALAFLTDSTRYISLSIGQNIQINKIPGVRQSYHDLSHHGQHPEKLKQLFCIESFITKEVAKFCSKIKRQRLKNNQSLLSQTQVLLGSGLGNASSHSCKNLPVVLLGGKFKHGQHIKTNSKPLSNLYTTLLRSHGLEEKAFATSDGDMDELLV